MERSGGVGGGRVEEDDGAVGEAGAFAEGGWCWGELEVSGEGDGAAGGTHNMRRRGLGGREGL